MTYKYIKKDIELYIYLIDLLFLFK